MSPRPWMPLYWPDYLGDTGHLRTIEHGAYLLLIGHYWLNGSLPDDDYRLAAIARMRVEDWRRIRGAIQPFFHDGWRHTRIDAELARSEEISNKRKAAALQKHSKCTPNAEQLHTHPQPQSQLHKKERKRKPAAEPPEFLDFWNSIPHREGSNPRFPALQAYCKAIKNGANPLQINAAAKRWNAETGEITKYVKTAVAWLNQRMYEDYHAEERSG